jgi:hypothetical protein
MNIINALNTFISESVPYITTNSINNLMDKVTAANINNLLINSGIYMNLIEGKHTYLHIGNISDNSNIGNFILKFNSIDAYTYIVNNINLFSSYNLQSSLADYDEQYVEQDNHGYYIILTRYVSKTDYSIYVIDAESREILLCCNYVKSILVTNIHKLAAARFTELSNYEYHNVIDFDDIPINIRNQLQALIIEISLL